MTSRDKAGGLAGQLLIMPTRLPQEDCQDILHHSRQYHYRPLEDDRDRRIIILEPAAQYDSPLKCSLVHRLWLPEKIRSLNLEQRRVHCRSAKSQWQSTQKRFLDTLRRTRNISEILRVDTTTDYPALRKTYRYSTRACEQVDNMYGYNYTAISYAWEEQEPMHELLCDNRVLHISQNIQDMLRRFRQTSYSRAFWIDSVCIDQENSSEKAAQVKSMGKIYQEADRVIVWLGEDNGSGESVIRILRSMRDQEFNDRLQRHLLVINPKPDVLRGIQDFLGRTWFHRRWPLQEVVLGRHVTVQCGKVQMDFVQFYHALREIYSIWKSASGLEYGVIERLRLIHRLRIYGPVQSPASFLGLLVVLHEAACSRAVDKLNSLVGLCGDFADLIPVSYVHMNSNWCFREFAHRVLLRDVKNLPAILSCAGAFASKATCISWVPDWGVDRQYFPLYLQQNIPGKPYIEEEKWDLLGPAPSRRVTTKITIRASTFGAIYRRGPVLSSDPSIQELVELVPKWWKLYTETVPAGTYGDFLTLITAGRVDESTSIDMSDQVFDDDVVFDVAQTGENLTSPVKKHHSENNTTFSSGILRAPVALEITSEPRLDNIRKVLQSSRDNASSRIIETRPSRATDETYMIPTLTETPARRPRGGLASAISGLSSKSRFLRTLRKKTTSNTGQIRALVRAPDRSSSEMVLYQRFDEEELIKLFYFYA